MKNEKGKRQKEKKKLEEETSWFSYSVAQGRRDLDKKEEISPGQLKDSFLIALGLYYFFHSAPSLISQNNWGKL